MEIQNGTIIAIIRGVEPTEVIEIQEALLQGGINWVEVSLSEEEQGLQCIQLLSENFGEKVNLGVGTVTSIEQAKKAIAAGARYIITPGWDRELIRELKELDITIFPGVFTPGEIMQALSEGIEVLKLFPANSLGASYIKNLKGPFPNSHLMAVGGINLENISDYLRAGCSSFAIGSDLVKRGATKEDKEAIKLRAQEYVRALQK